jgi:hypothetical protein
MVIDGEFIPVAMHWSGMLGAMCQLLACLVKILSPNVYSRFGDRPSPHSRH